jgi:hypothetical protein
MSTNTQLQKIAPPKIRRLRHRRRLIAGSPRVQGRHPALDNFLIREAARANLTPLRLTQALAIGAGGTTYAVGDVFNILGGTGAGGTGIVEAVSAGVVTAARVLDPGEYTVNPGAGAATSGAGDDGLTVDTTLTSAVTGVTEAELLAAIEGVGTSDLNRNIGDTFDIQVAARNHRNPRNSSQTYAAAGVPIS